MSFKGNSAVAASLRSQCRILSIIEAFGTRFLQGSMTLSFCLMRSRMARASPRSLSFLDMDRMRVSSDRPRSLSDSFRYDCIGCSHVSIPKLWNTRCSSVHPVLTRSCRLRIVYCVRLSRRVTASPTSAARGCASSWSRRGAIKPSVVTLPIRIQSPVVKRFRHCFL